MLFGIPYHTTPKVLVLCDSPVNSQFLCAELQKARHPLTALVAPQIDAARRLVEEHGFDLVIVAADTLNKQQMLQWIADFKAAPRRRMVPVIVMTANRASSIRVQLTKSGADVVAMKPVPREEFRATVQTQLQRKYMSDELEHVEHLLTGLIHAVDARDATTAGHSHRVAHLSLTLARTLGWGEGRQGIVFAGALLHDIGKLAIPDSILRKPGPLTEEEMSVVQKHPVWGTVILKPLQSLRPITNIVRHHHERWDGAGYPDGLQGPKTAPEARLVAVADGIDAMLSHRPYRDGLAPRQVVEILRRNAGSQWDPEIVAAALAVDLPVAGQRLMFDDCMTTDIQPFQLFQHFESFKSPGVIG